MSYKHNNKRHESPTVTLIWRESKYKAHKLNVLIQLEASTQTVIQMQIGAVLAL